jgi:hypothetical protein
MSEKKSVGLHEEGVEDYREMLRVNIDEYINLQAGSSR